MHRITIIIPAYNEEKRLPPTLRSIKQWMDQANHPSIFIEEVMIVDDGSTDGTRNIASSCAPSLPVKIISFSKNCGKGSAVKAGIQQAQSEWILLMDADGATPIGDITRLIDCQNISHASIIIGSRVVDSSMTVSMQWHRRMIGWIYHFLTSPLIPGIRDASCGFKLLRSDTARDLFASVHTNGYGYDLEFLALAHRKKMRIEEVQVSWRAIGGSKVSIFRDGICMFLSACALSWRFLFRVE